MEKELKIRCRVDGIMRELWDYREQPKRTYFAY